MPIEPVFDNPKLKTCWPANPGATLPLPLLSQEQSVFCKTLYNFEHLESATSRCKLYPVRLLGKFPGFGTSVKLSW
jgi:hypothetical protein